MFFKNLLLLTKWNDGYTYAKVVHKLAMFEIYLK